MVLEKTLKSHLDCKEIQPVHPKGDQYEIYYSTSKNGTYKKWADVDANKVKYTASNLKSGTVCYFKVRACKTINGNTVYGAFSSVKYVKVK